MDDHYVREGSDRIEFDNMSFEDLWFSQSGNDLNITIVGSEDQVQISNWYTSSIYQIEHIETNASVLLNNQVDLLVNAMASYDVPLGAGNVIPQDTKDVLAVTLAAAWNI